MDKVKIAIVGVGNCVSSLIQGIHYYKDKAAEILTNYLPVGSEEAARFYADCALEAGVAFINNIPHASSPMTRHLTGSKTLSMKIAPSALRRRKERGKHSCII